ncbi:MAG: hypothetical protein S4CHLAM37_12330 [Chlamydiia bacterium]|nr:hypothetical protein [Chlamydiia bacterium]
MAGYLLAEEGPLAGLIIRFEEGNEWIIGRDPDVCYQVLEDPMVSRKHIICRNTDEGFVIENLSATNPASVNGNPITEQVTLQESDVLQIGSSLFKFTEHDPSHKQVEEEAEKEKHPTIFEEEGPLDTLSLNEVTKARWMIKVISGPNTGAEFGLEKDHSYVIGKDPSSCDIVFQDLSVSRQHAKINIDENEQVFVEDLKSKNGTFLNGRALEEPKLSESQDLIALGTTSFLVIDREQARETIYSPTATLAAAYESNKDQEEEEEQKAEEKKSWKETLIPTRHLILAGTFIVLVVIGVASSISLFKSSHIEVAKHSPDKTLKEIFKRFPGVEYTYNEHTGKIFLVGNVLTDVDHQELTYLLNVEPYITSIEDTVTIDEIVWGDFNAFLMKNPNWRAVTMTAYEPGKFVLKGYVQTLQNATNLMEYVNQNFPYNDKLENQVVVANNLETEVQSLLLEKGFLNVTFQLSNGEIVLAGRVNENNENDFKGFIKELKKISGIRSVRDFVIITTASTARINLSDKYKITGTSKFGNVNQYVVINGTILTNGDTLDGMTLTKIEQDSVLLEKDGLKYKINYNQQ